MQFQISKNQENLSSTSKVTSKAILIILLNLFSIGNAFEFKATQIFREPMTQCTHESHANVNHMRT